MPRRSQADDLAWPPIGDDLPVVDLHGSHTPATGRGPAGGTRGTRAESRTRGAARAGPPAEVATPVPRAASLLERARGLPWRLQAAAFVVLCVAVTVAALVVRAGAEDPIVGSSAGVGEGNRAALQLDQPVPARPASLSIRSDPPGATVFVNDRRVGVTPVTVASIEPGEHRVMIRHGDRTVRHTARVEAGESVSVVVPIQAAAARAPAVPAGDGSIRIVAPVELRVMREGRLLGTSEMARIPLAPGTHTLALANESAGYRETRTVRVTSGRMTTVEVDVPEETVAINAIPWAEVIVDGRRVGETPLGTLKLAVGPHVVVLRHPRFGEKTVNTVVKAGEPARLSVDMRQ